MRRRADRERKAAEQRHAAIETHQLHRDLALVVIHRQHRIEGAALGAQEHGVGGKRSLHGDAIALAGCDDRRNNIDLLTAEIASVAGMRIEPGDRDARPREACIAHAGIGQLERAMDAFAGQSRGNVLERDVGRHACVPESVQHIEFACGGLESDHFRRERDLVVILGAGEPHRLLVERGEANGIDAVVAAEFERVLVVGKREPAAGKAGNSPLDVVGIEVAEIDEQRLALRCAEVGSLLHCLQLGLDAGNARALVEDAAVTDHDDPAAGADIVLHHEPCSQLRADAGGISHCQCNERLCGHMITFSRAVS
ncbi:hypothetical protein ACVWW4_001151 [Bradyrhizobium sp. LB7.1]